MFKMFTKSAYVKLLAGLMLWLMPGPTAAQWSNDPAINTPVCTAVNKQYTLNFFVPPYAKYVSIPDGSGGMIVTWQDLRLDAGGANRDIYAQRLGADGIPLWTLDGVAICTNSNDQYGPTLVSDGAGGAIVFWPDKRNGNYDIYAQRVNANGVTLWANNGIPISVQPNIQARPTAVSDGIDGAFVTWTDERSGTAALYAQHLSGSGTLLWPVEGVVVCASSTSLYGQGNPLPINDGMGGMIIAWSDYRDAVQYDVYAQRVTAAGVPLWSATGAPVCTNPSQQYVPVVVTNGSGGAIFAWEDHRNGNFRYLCSAIRFVRCAGLDNGWYSM